MITAYFLKPTVSTQIIDAKNHTTLTKAVWIDMLSPTKEEVEWVEHALDIMVPTHSDMREIEISSRLYAIKETLYMTASLIAGSASIEPSHDSVTYILTPTQLLTLRYIEPMAFNLFARDLKQGSLSTYSASSLFVCLLDVTIDRLADILEMIAFNLEQYAKKIFMIEPGMKKTANLDYAALMQEMGKHANLSSKVRESLLTYARLLSYFRQMAEITLADNTVSRLHTLNKDIASLSDYATFITGKVNFLLDATLGMVSIEQNNIIKIFSVAAVIFLPPTLIASIYGMNFHYIPELNWKYGYIVAIVIMVLSAVVPYQFFKWRKWL